VNLQCCNIEQLFGFAMKKKHWVLKEALGAQGNIGCCTGKRGKHSE